MRVFELRDETDATEEVLAYLECYEHPRAFFFELPPHADPWRLPFILHEFAQRGFTTIDEAWSRRWVQSRLVPHERQNLGEVLRANGLDEYDELRLLELSEGRCSQDGCYLVPVAREQLPPWYVEREGGRLRDVYAIGGFRLLSISRSGETIVSPVRALLEGRRRFLQVLSDADVFCRVSLQAGGHGAQWGSALAVSVDELREVGQALPLTADDVAQLVEQAVCDTAEAMRLLGCTRQNISDLVRRKKLKPLRTEGRGMLFLRSDVLARR